MRCTRSTITATPTRWVLTCGVGLLAAGAAALLPLRATPVARAEAAGDAAGKDLVQTAMAAGQFKTLTAALKAAGLVETLQGAGPFTVFAPTDEAFAKLPTGAVEELLKPENKEKLTAILTYHVLAGKVLSKDITSAVEPKSVNGKALKVEPKDGKVMVNDATVVKADVEASNGVIHVIDKVLMP